MSVCAAGGRKSGRLCCKVKKETTKGGLPRMARVVYRSHNNANANGGVSYANANNDSANVNANIGSRLANNGKVISQRYVLAYSNGDVSPKRSQWG